MNSKNEKVTIREMSRDEEGKKQIEKTQIHSHNIDTIKYVEKKLIDKGVQRLDRHSRTGVAHPPPKSGRGGKFTWLGPGDAIQNELSPAPAAIDANDPNYVDEEPMARVEVDPQLQFQ